MLNIKVLQTFQTSITCGKPSRFDFLKWENIFSSHTGKKKRNLSNTAPAGGTDDLFAIKACFKSTNREVILT